jgi:hypothetical protein
MSAPPSGTAVEASGVSRRMLVMGGAVAASLGILAAVLLGADGQDEARKVEPAANPATESAAPARIPPAVPLAAPQVTQPQLRTGEQAAAVEQLRRAFGKARLYSQISIQGDQLELRSSACQDRQLIELLSQSSARLGESGLHRVRCLEPHGQVVFSREL